MDLLTIRLTAIPTSDPSAYVEFTNVRVQKKVQPMLSDSLSPEHPLILPNILPEAATPGSNLVMNAALLGNDSQIPNWFFGGAERTQLDGENVIAVNGENDTASTAFQNNPYFLKNFPHALTCKAKVSEAGKVGAIAILSDDNSFSSVVLITSTEWQDVSIVVNSNNWLQPIIYMEAGSGQGSGWQLYAKDFEILSVGEEWLPTKSPHPLIQAEAKEWTFENGLDSDDWLVSQLLNSQVANTEITPDGNLLLNAYSSSKEAATVMTTDYFASGRFDAWIKMGPVYDSSGNEIPAGTPVGCAFAFYPFQFELFSNSQPRWYDEPNPVRNSEIDWEFPSDNPPGNTEPNFPFCPVITYANAHNNTWGGQRGGESGQIQQHITLPNGVNAADGSFHQYTIVWNSGKDRGGETRTPGYIEWYFDTGEDLDPSKMTARWEGNSYGFDNIPVKAGRIYVGAWFPTSGPYGADTCEVESWAGTPNWARATFEIQKVSYEPITSGTKPNRDRWEAEFEPNNNIWGADRYP